MSIISDYIYAGGKISEASMCEYLEDICDRVHSSCDEGCPVFLRNGHKVPWTSDLSTCECFKNGKAMLEFIKVKTRY